MLAEQVKTLQELKLLCLDTKQERMELRGILPLKPESFDTEYSLYGGIGFLHWMDQCVATEYYFRCTGRCSRVPCAAGNTCVTWLFIVIISFFFFSFRITLNPKPRKIPLDRHMFGLHTESMILQSLLATFAELACCERRATPEGGMARRRRPQHGMTRRRRPQHVGLCAETQRFFKFVLGSASSEATTPARVGVTPRRDARLPSLTQRMG